MQRRPVYFQGCFGWIHEPDGGCSRAVTGVVLVSAFGQEEVCTHYGIMAFAEDLARRGMAVIRFDYQGVGDSAAAEFSLDSFASDVASAAALLRHECGAGPIVIAGLRLGTMAALQAAERVPGLAGLVLMAPTLSGSAFLRETRAAAKMNPLSNLDPVPAPESDHPLNTNGFYWPATFQRELATFDAAKLPAPTVPVLMLAARGDRRPAKLAANWRNGGHSVVDHDFNEYETWMQDPTTSTPPSQTFRVVGDWIGELPSVDGPFAVEPINSSTTLRGDSFEETPVMFGEHKQLFGVLCEPLSKPGTPVAALLLHEGSSHHIGDGGAYVTTTRRLAALGIASLRMDLTGMGDSPAGDNLRHPHYDPERISEALAGVDVMEGAGYPMAVVFGLCSGAYAAWQVSLADKRIVGSAIANLQKFLWHYGDDIRVTNRNNKRTARAYFKAMRNGSEWQRMFSGKADIPGTLRVLTRRAAGGLYHHARNLMPLAPVSETAKVHRQMKALAQRRVLTNLVFADDDPGLRDVSKQFGRGGQRLAAFAPAQLHLFPHADHHFNGSSARQRYLDLIEDLMKAAIKEHAPKPIAGSPSKQTASDKWKVAASS